MSKLQKTAQKNQAYYLSEKEADNGQRQWFRYVKTMDSYSEPVLISQQMAQELLGNDFSLRKPMEKKALRALVDDLKQSQSKISISFSGKLIEGHNVLQAIVASDAAIVIVSFNISDKLSFLT